MRDFLDNDGALYEHVVGVCAKVAQNFGFAFIETPKLEETALFRRSVGESSDIVGKEMYEFSDKGGESICLRPEGTAGVVRAFLQAKLDKIGGIKRWFYHGSMFRYERPQRGRQREFHQFGIEALGEENPAVDAEVILLAVDFLRSLGLKDLELSLNSVGCPSCRPVYRKALQDYFRDKLDDLCDDCKDRFDRSPLRILDCKVDADKPFMKDAPRITDCLCDACQDHFHMVQEYLSHAGISFQLDPRLVRGLDYYTKTAFEIKYAPLGAQSAVAGGGRYDGLIEEIGGKPTPAVGFATGLERVLLALEKQGLLPEQDRKTDGFVIALGDAAQLPAFGLLEKLRRAGLKAGMDYAGRSMKAQMKQANKAGARYALIIGEEEVKESCVQLKNMATSEQQKVSFDNIVEKLYAEVKG